MPDPRILLVGNPNSGKTTLFNVLTGANQTVGNWPGVTVERRDGRFTWASRALTVTDIPGIYSLDLLDDSGSLDEGAARAAILEGGEEIVVNVVDASNLERNLYLTLQLAELRRPMIVVLNMLDAAERDGLVVDADGLARELGCPVVGVVAAKRVGIDPLKDTILAALEAPCIPTIDVHYAPSIEVALLALQAKMDGKRPECQRRAQALALLERAHENPEREEPAVRDVLTSLEKTLSDDLDIVVADARYTRIRKLTELVLRRQGDLGASVTERIDRVVLNRWLGIPIFLLAMYLLFFLTIAVGGAFVDFFDGIAGALFVEGPRALLQGTGLPNWMIALLSDGVGKGIQTVATFIPTIAVLFLFLSFLEDSGYMARAAFVMDRFMRTVGLPGKAFVPLIVGFGCNVPAIMSTRTLEDRRDRLLTVLMSPFMSCSARLPVYAILAAAFFPHTGQNVVFSLYLIGVAAALGTGFLMRRSLLAGSNSSFVMELPQYHLPSLRSMSLRTWERLKGFVVRAGKVIVVMVAALGVLTAIDTRGNVGSDVAPEASLLSALGKTITPIFGPMGIEQNNWPATVGLVTGIFAKEAVVGTMTPLYQRLGGETADAQAAAFSFGGSLREALLTIPANLSGLVTSLGDPLGFSGAAATETPAVAQQEMQRRFGSPAAAYAFLLFVLLYVPCVSAIGAIYKETDGRWTTFAVAWTTGLAYGAAVLFYQASRLATHPQEALLHLAVLLLAAVAVVVVLVRRRSDASAGSSGVPPRERHGLARGS